MCTVTFIPFRNKVFITSNRDEHTLRVAALPPAVYEMTSGNLVFPKDGQAGGTWIAMHSNGNAMVLLNGAFEKHLSKPPYKKSRGLVFLEIFDSEDPLKQFLACDLWNIEPFTLVCWQNGALWEMRWDGASKHATPKPAGEPQIWSSATLYDQIAIEKRKAWFYEWLQKEDEITLETILSFHEFGGEGNQAIDLMMSRNGGILKTISITAIELTPGDAIIRYQDNLNGVVSLKKWALEIEQAKTP